MLKHPEKANYLLFYLLLILELVIVLFLGFRRHTNIAFQKDPYYCLNDNWNYIDDQNQEYCINLPEKLDAGEDNTITIYRNLPRDNTPLENLLIITKHQTLKVYVDNELIFSRTSDAAHKYFDVPSNIVWNIIELPPKIAGKTLTITFSSKYREFAGDINEIYVGSKSSFILYGIRNNGFRLTASSITLFFGIAIIIIYLFMKKRLQLNRSLLYLGWFTILCSIWLMMESNLTQLFIENEFVISTITYLSLMTFPIPIIIYITLIDNFHFKKPLYYLADIFIISAFIFIILQTFNIMDFHQSTIFVRFEIIVLLGIFTTLLLVELIKYRNTEITITTISSCILFIFGMIEIIQYYQYTYKTGYLFQAGFIIFVLFQTWDALHKITDMVKLIKSAKHYKFLATKDLLTSCRNRVAYAKDMSEISLDRKVIIFVTDMNNMKVINDTYGHHAGDEVIIYCSQCLLKIFGKRVYRIGGDEFVMIQYDLSQAKIEQLIEDFHKECAKANAQCNYPFTMSIGYAIYDKSLDQTIYDTFNRADKNMYKDKQELKKNFT